MSKKIKNVIIEEVTKHVETLSIKNDFLKLPWRELVGKYHPKTKNKSFSIQLWCLIATAAVGAPTIRTTPQLHRHITGQV